MTMMIILIIVLGNVNSVVCDINVSLAPLFLPLIPYGMSLVSDQAAANASGVFSHFMAIVFGFSAAQRDAALRSEPHPRCGVDKRAG